MSLLDGLRHRLHVLLRGETYADEQSRELSFHLELAALAESSEGRAQQEAEVAARRVFGNLTYYREETRRMTPLAWLDRIRLNVSYAARGLKRSPGFTIAIVATLGLGLGVNAAMFSFLDRVFIRAPSGVAAPAAVRRLYQGIRRPREPGGRLIHDGFSYPYYRAMRQADSSLAVAAYTEPESTAMSLADARIPIRLSSVTANYFGLLGLQPQRGRFFVGEESRIETPTPVAVISDALWHTTCGGDQGILGKRIVVEALPYTIVGVAPAGFSGIDLSAVDVWLPANTSGEPTRSGEPWYDTFQSSFHLIARLQTSQAEQGMTAIATAALRGVKLRGFEYDSTAIALTGPIMRAVGPAKPQQELSISTRLAGVAFIVLLIACANATNLLLVRATRRRREFAMRRALGASVGRLYTQVLTESVVLGLLGGAVATILAFWAATALRRLLLPSVHWASGAVDLTTILFIGVVSVIVGLAAGLAPAVHGTRPDVTSTLKSGTRESIERRSALRSSLLVVQTALSIVLLVGAGLFVRSLDNVRSIDLGYDAEHTIIVRPIFAVSQPPVTEIAAALSRLADRLRAVPGVEGVATASSAPMLGFSFIGLSLPGSDSLPRLGDEMGASTIAVSAGYFHAMGVRLIAGRDFNAGDRKGAPGVLIASQSMARTYWPGTTAIGNCVIIGRANEPCTTVVGVAADVHRMDVIEKPVMQSYIPAAQAGDFLAADQLLLRARTQNVPMVKTIAAAELRRAFPNLWTPSVRTLNQALDRQFRPWRLGATLFTAFGVLALIVAAVGVYSVVAYAASQRIHEMGIRVALGARTSDVIRLVVAGGLRVVGVGVALGIGTSLALGRVVASLLFGVKPNDPVILAVAAALLALLAIAASLVPGWRAARVDPVAALRSE